MLYYHITPLKNLESILESGLIVESNRTSLDADILGVYLTSCWKELLLSDTYPEINHHLEIAILEVDCSGLILVDDPEYDNTFWDDELDNLDVKIHQSDIEPSRLKLLGKICLSSIPNYYSEILINENFVQV